MKLDKYKIEQSLDNKCIFSKISSLIFVCVLFVFAFVGSVHREIQSNKSVIANCVGNEAIQDKVAHEFKNEGLEECLLNAKHKYEMKLSMDSSKWPNQDEHPINRPYSIGYLPLGSKLYYSPNEKTMGNYISSDSDIELYKWNENIYYVTQFKKLITYANKELMVRCLIILALSYITAIVFTIFVYRNTTSCVIANMFTLVVMLFLILVFAVYITAWTYRIGLFELGKSPAIDSELCIKIKNIAKKLQQSEKGTVYKKMMSIELSGFNSIEVFIAKHPTFPIEYVRFNINPFTYLFVGDEIKDPKTINKYMDYEKICDGVWLGKYTELIKNTEEMNRFCYFYITGIWAIFIIFACFWGMAFKRLMVQKKEKIQTS